MDNLEEFIANANFIDLTLISLLRFIQLGSGAISLILSSIVLIRYNALSINTVTLFVSIALLTIGIERLVAGLEPLTTSKRPLGITKKTTNLTNIALGSVALFFAIIASMYPHFTSGILLVLLSLAISIMFNGFARILQGASDRHQRTWLRALSMGLGIVSASYSIFLSHSNAFGIVFNPPRILAIILVVYGIENILFGITGKLSVDDILKNK